jgi:hypothetical protein
MLAPTQGKTMLIISLLAAAAAATSPTYLRCTFTGDAEVMFTADEAHSAVTVSIPSTGYVETLPAAFSPDAVRFRNRVIAYEISRTALTAHRTFDGAAADPGTCKVEDAPKRAF